MEVCVFYNKITIKDGYQVEDKDMLSILNDTKEKHPNCRVFLNRSMKSLLREWRAHNRLYKLGLYRKHVKDVDMECYIERKYEILWNIIGF